jgi:hypothetical protein
MAKGFLSAISCAPGAVGSPGIYLGSDSTTGLYRIGANNYGFTVSGTKILDIASTGSISFTPGAINGLSIGEAFTNYDGWNKQLNLAGTAHARLTIKTATVRMGVYAHDAWQTIGASALGGFVGTYTNHPVGIIINAVVKVAIDTAGNVGMGILVPRTTLHIAKASNTLTNIKATVASNAINISSPYTAGADYAPGLTWSTEDNSPTIVKAGIFAQMTSSGSQLRFGTSNNYATGITNNALVITPTGASYFQLYDATTNTAPIVLSLQKSSSGVAAAGSGAIVQFTLQDAGGSAINTNSFASIWADPAIGVRSADMVFYRGIANAQYEALRLRSDGYSVFATGTISPTHTVTAANTSGYGFWGSAPVTYGILMSTAADGTYGGRIAGESTSDYNMYFTMTNGTNRGFVFRNVQATPLFAINGNGVRSSVDVTIVGTLYATAKSFKIDHPTKPGKKLVHGSLEGPENGVYVRGKTKSNIIELPEYWTKLVDEDSITVQLTAVGRGQDLYVEKIEGNKVYIANGNLLSKKIDCFYFIQAERIDTPKLRVEQDGD